MMKFDDSDINMSQEMECLICGNHEMLEKQQLCDQCENGLMVSVKTVMLL